MLHSPKEIRQPTHANTNTTTNNSNKIQQAITISPKPSVILPDRDIIPGQSINGNARRSESRDITAYRIPKPQNSNPHRPRIGNPSSIMDSSINTAGSKNIIATTARVGNFQTNDRPNTRNLSSSNVRVNGVGSGSSGVELSVNGVSGNANKKGTNSAGCVTDAQNLPKNPIKVKSGSLSTSSRLHGQTSDSVSETGTTDATVNNRLRRVGAITNAIDSNTAHQTQIQQTRNRRQNTSILSQQAQPRASDNFYSSQSTMHSMNTGAVVQSSRKRGSHRRGSVTSSDGSSSSSSSCSGSCSSEDGDSNTTSSGEPNLPYPGFPEIALKYLTQDTKPRKWCLMLITNPYPFQITLLLQIFFFPHGMSFNLGKFVVIVNLIAILGSG